MKTNNNAHVNENDVAINELSLEEMEDVNGGGIKEIVAATTLAAMAMTGNTVSAFGLANAMAEENTAHIEAAPVEDGEVYAQAFEENAVMAEDIEVTAELAEAVVEEEEFSLGENGLEPGSEGSEEEKPVELGDTDLGEATDTVITDVPESGYVMNVGECSKVPVSKIAKASFFPPYFSSIGGAVTRKSSMLLIKCCQEACPSTWPIRRTKVSGSEKGER